jgi:hypothetical protein
MGAPIRSAEEITQIINRGQHAIASLGLEIVQDAKRGADNNDPDWRWKQMRLILLRSFYQNILTVDGTINNYYQANEKPKNNILTGILKLSGIYNGPAIPLLTGGNLPMYFFPSSSGVSTGGNSGGAATPGGITFEALDVDAPGEVVDRIEANGSNYAFYIVNVYGNGSGEGSKGAVLLVTWRGASAPVVTEYGGADVGGTTAGVTFSAALVSGFIELTANVPSDNWTIRGTRISFQNISFQNPLGPMPTGGTTGQYLRKSSNADYQTEWSTLLWQYITDVTASLAEINRVAGVTSPIQNQINNLTSALANYLLLAGGTMGGAIAMGNNKITGLAEATANGEAVRYEQISENWVNLPALINDWGFEKQPQYQISPNGLVRWRGILDPDLFGVPTSNIFIDSLPALIRPRLPIAVRVSDTNPNAKDLIIRAIGDAFIVSPDFSEKICLDNVQYYAFPFNTP